MARAATDSSSLISTWHRDAASEARMGDGHRPIWARMIDLSREHHLRQAKVLDFGCNRGGFLHFLYAQRPFAAGVGIDIAAESIAVANAAKADLPLSYHATDDVRTLGLVFDIAFSHEVVYLLPDLARHAREMRHVLTPGAPYYAVMGCHRDNPLWPRWRTLIAETSNLTVQDHALDDVVAAFRAEGFTAEARPLGLDGFIPCTGPSNYFRSLAEQLAYYQTGKVLMRFVAPV